MTSGRNAAGPDLATRTVHALGRLIASMPAGERRTGQEHMARAVAEAIEGPHHLVVQAGTGVGKSLAYLVPAVVSGKRTVVATATKALQDQLATKDLPAIRAALAPGLRIAVLKGRANYVCLQRLREHESAAGQLQFAGLDEPRIAEEVRRIATWAQTATTGDRADLVMEPSSPAWRAVSVGSDECPGRSRCPSGDRCFAERAREAAAAADVVIVNTHLYGLHLAAGGTLLPEHEVVVIDEAHRFEDTVSATYGVALNAARVRQVARTVRTVLAEADLPEGIEAAASALGEALTPWEGRRFRRALADDVRSVLERLRSRLADALAVVRALDAPTQEAAARQLRGIQVVTALMDDLDALATPAKDQVAWVEGSGSEPTVRVAPLDVAPMLASSLFATSTVILTSATIPPGLTNTLGAPVGTVESEVESPFDYDRNTLLYCGAHLPDPRSDRFDPAVRAELIELVQAAGGRTLALFTSHRAMHEAADALRTALELPVLAQGDLPAPRLLEAFAADPTTSLCATMSYWQGIDVPGPSLSLVTIDRIPFPRPDDPLLQARRERARAGAFAAIDLPRAATLLAQGAGRLVRTATDRGVVAVFDPRLATQVSYRWALVNALPPMRRTRKLADALAFLTALRLHQDGGAQSPTPGR